MKEDNEYKWNGTDYFGASLESLTRLGASKGYALVGTDPRGVNAFFVQQCFAEKFLLPGDAVFHWRPPGYGAEGTGHPPGDGPFVEI